MKNMINKNLKKEEQLNENRKHNNTIVKLQEDLNITKETAETIIQFGLENSNNEKDFIKNINLVSKYSKKIINNL